VREVLGGGAQHRRPADVNHLDGVFHSGAALRGDRAEGIEVDADEVERLDLLLVQRLDVVGPVAPREDAAVDARVQRLHPPAEHLGSAGHVFDPRHGETALLEERSGAAARDELEAELLEPARELLEPRLVVDGDQRAHSCLTTCGSSRCSTACTRSRSDLLVSSG
jgi:hypothetical protein